jgi:hypothetical protein
MKPSHFNRLLVLLTVIALHASTMLILTAAENDDIRGTAEKFVRQVVERDTNAVLHSYQMTDEFRAAMPNADTVIELATGIDRHFGQLGDAVNSEIVEHPDLGLRSVFFYYQGAKHPAKLWVSFSGETIAGFHFNVWNEGYAERIKFPSIVRGMVANMTGSDAFVWDCLLITMLMLSLFLLTGKGTLLIAGNHTLSKEVRAKYDVKAISRSIGLFLLWMTFCITLLPLSIHSGVAWMPFLAGGIIAASIVVFTLYASTENQFHKDVIEEEHEENNLWQWGESITNVDDTHSLLDTKRMSLCLTIIAVTCLILAIPVLL